MPATWVQFLQDLLQSRLKLHKWAIICCVWYSYAKSFTINVIHLYLSFGWGHPRNEFLWILEFYWSKISVMEYYFLDMIMYWTFELVSMLDKLVRYLGCLE